MNQVFSFLLSAFLGYLIGRFGHKYVNVWMGDPKWVPHHWMTGLVIAVFGFVFPANPYRWHLVAFGIGVFVSDLNDFFHLRFFSPDGPGPKRFWGID